MLGYESLTIEEMKENIETLQTMIDSGIPSDRQCILYAIHIDILNEHIRELEAK